VTSQSLKAAAHLVLACLLVAASLAVAAPARAQGSGDTQSDVADMVPVMLDGRVLFRVPGFPAARANERAQAIAERIARAAADSSIKLEDIHVIEESGRVNLQAGDIRLMAVTPEDARLIGASQATLGEYCRIQIVAAIEAYRHERQAGPLLRASGRAVLATLVFLALLWIANRALTWLAPRITAAWQRRVTRLQHQAFRVVRLERFSPMIVSALGLLRFVVALALVVPFVEYTFNLFPWTRPIAHNLSTILLGPLQTIAQGVLGFIPNLVFLLVLFVVVRLILRVAAMMFYAIEQRTLTIRHFDPELAMPTLRLMRVLVVAFAVVVGYPYLPGSGSEAFKGVSIFLGVIFSLGSSSALANIIAGYSLQYRRAFHVGDVIRIGSDFGSVTQIRLQVTHVRTPKNEEVIIPNSTILNANVINYSVLAKERGLILHTEVGIGYETPWRQVEAMLLEAASRTEGLQREPPPFVLQRLLGDFAVTYELNVYCDAPQDQIQLYSRLHRNILDVFNEYGVQIMTPRYETDPPIPKVVPKDQWYLAPANEQERNGQIGDTPLRGPSTKAG
jgi:small-conductance mechanosensitive channel